MLRRSSLAWILKRLALWVVALSVILVLYGLGKLGARFTEPVVLPLTALDVAIPLVPWTVWVYGTITWVSLAAWLTLPTRADCARMLTAITVAAASCSLVFWLFPTSFPRELFALGALDTASLRELSRLRDADSATNCLPSLHVALAWTIAATWARALRRPGAQALVVLWAVVVSVATITTKQHFVVDVPTGAAVGLLAHWVARRLIAGETSTPAWVRAPKLALEWETHAKAIRKLRETVEGHQWSLDEIAWPEGPLQPLDPTLVRLINELIYVEEIAGLNFSLLAEASACDDLRALYAIFADEERRHAEGLRKVLELHGADLRRPGLGNSLVLDEFDALDPQSEADVLLVATATPVFETMLDAGTVPFLKQHPALESDYFDDFVRRLTRDEAAHMGVNWMVIREAGERYGGLRGLSLLLNPSIYRGMVGVPFMSLDVYSLAHRMGYRFETLLPAFGKIWRLHRRYGELRAFPLWWLFRLFTAAGLIATVISVGLARFGLIFVRFWTMFTSVTDLLARLTFGRRLLDKRGLPDVPS